MSKFSDEVKRLKDHRQYTVLLKTKNYRRSYSGIKFLNIYPVEKLAEDIASFLMVHKDDTGHSRIDSGHDEHVMMTYIMLKIEVQEILENNIAGGALTVIYPDKSVEPHLKLSEFAVWAIEHKFICPQEFLDKAPSGMTTPDKADKQKSDPSKDSQQDTNQLAITTGTSGSRYCFIKADKVWNLQYGDLALKGVKDLVGMSYICELLQHPDKPIHVFNLQGLSASRHDTPDADAYDVKDEASGTEITAWQASDEKAIQEYNVRILKIEDELAVANKVHNRTRIEKLEKEKATIESHIREASFRPKDPSVETNRKRILKSISDAIKAIRKLETMCEFNDKPLSSHLHRFIRTGTSCSYVAAGDDLPSWQF